MVLPLCKKVNCAILEHIHLGHEQTERGKVFFIMVIPPKHLPHRCCPVADQDGRWCLWPSAPGSHSVNPSTSICHSSPPCCLDPVPPSLQPSQSKTPPKKTWVVQLLWNNTDGTIKSLLLDQYHPALTVNNCTCKNMGSTTPLKQQRWDHQIAPSWLVPPSLRTQKPYLQKYVQCNSFVTIKMGPSKLLLDRTLYYKNWKYKENVELSGTFEYFVYSRSTS